MKNRNVLAIVPALLLIAALFSCSNPAAVTPLSEEERSEVLDATMQAFDTGMGSAATPVAAPESLNRTITTVDVTTGITLAVDDVENIISINFTNYESAPVSLNGKVVMDYDDNFTTFKCTADLSILYNGETHKLTWIVTMTDTYSVTGSYTFDGVNYDFTEEDEESFF